MPDPTHEGACTAAVDLIDVRCASSRHPHRGSHHATRTLDDGTRCTVFWYTLDAPTKDSDLDAEAAAHPVPLQDLTAENVQLATPRLTRQQRRTDPSALAHR